MKTILCTVFLFLGLTLWSQQENVFLDRGFWMKDPSLTLVKQKIAEGNDATVFNDNGFDATTYALIANANPEVVNYLLSLKGNEVDKRTHDSRIYLHWAAFGGGYENVKTLLRLGSATDARDSRGNTPLTFAAAAGLTNPKIYDLFIDHGVDLASEKNPEGANVLLLCAPFMQEVKEMDYFIKKGLSLKGTDDQGNGIFNYAARRGNVSFLKSLVKNDVDFKTPNKEGGNAFMFAAQGTRGFTNSIEVYEYLQSLGLKPDVVTVDGSTPLHRIAGSKVDISIIEFFLKAGAAVNQKDKEGNTPFLNACNRNTLEIVNLISSRTTDINEANHDGQTALMLATAHNTPEVVAYLIHNKASAAKKDEHGNSVAYYLVDSYNARNPEEFEQKFEYLQKMGIEMGEVQAGGNNLYHLAAKKGDLALAKRLSEFDIPINEPNEEGMTALHYAAMKAKDDLLMRYLISIGSDIHASTEFGETAYDLATENEILQKKKTNLEFLK